MAITNTRGKISNLCPANIYEVQLYLVPVVTEIDSLLRISNLDTLPSTYSVWHCSAGHGDVAATDLDVLASTVIIDPVGSPPHEISIHAGPTETIRVKSGTASKITFHLSGNKKVVA